MQTIMYTCIYMYFSDTVRMYMYMALWLYVYMYSEHNYMYMYTCVIIMHMYTVHARLQGPEKFLL